MSAYAAPALDSDGSERGAMLTVDMSAIADNTRSFASRTDASVSGVRPGTACQIWATTGGGQQAAGGGGWTVARSDPHAWYPASVPFPAGSLASFGITAHGKALVTIPLRPGTRTAPANAASAAASIPVTR